MKLEKKSQWLVIPNRLKPFSLFCFGLFILPSSFAQSQSLLEAEFDSIFTPLETVRNTNCSRAVNWQEGNPSALSDEQTALFRRAYVAALNSDEDVLKSVVSDNTYYQDLYGFINSLKTLALNKEGIMFLYEQRFDQNIRQHRLITERFDGFEPDVLVNIVWCSISADNGDTRQTGGFAYLSLIDGEWKFQSR